MSMSKHVKMQDGRVWGYGCGLVFNFNFNIGQIWDVNVASEAVLIPVNQIDGLTDEQIGQHVRSLIGPAKAIGALEVVSLQWGGKDLEKRASLEDIKLIISLVEPHTQYNDQLAQAKPLLDQLLSEKEAEQRTKEKKRELVRKRRASYNSKHNNLLLALIDRDGYVCAKCNEQDDITIDHVTPLSKGGTDELDNLRLLCRSCNSKKSDKVISVPANGRSAS